MMPGFDAAIECNIYYTAMSCYSLVTFCNDEQQ